MFTLMLAVPTYMFLFGIGPGLISRNDARLVDFNASMQGIPPTANKKEQSRVTETVDLPTKVS